MSVNLQKGQKIDLTKGNASLRRVMVGLGWDEAEQPVEAPKGFFGSLFGGSPKPQSIDCDAMAFLLDRNGQIAKQKDVVYYQHLKHESGAVIHQGDNLTGAGDGDDEQILINLPQLPSDIEKVVLVVNIYKAKEKHQHFGMINNAFIRLVDADTNNELCIYNLSENYDGMTAMVFGELYKHDGEWKFNAIGQPLAIEGVYALAEKYGFPRNAWK